MKTLVNKFELSSYNNNNVLDIPAGSRLQHIKTHTSIMAYYEMFTYVIDCSLVLEGNVKKNIVIRCSKYIGAKEPKVDCVKGNLHSQKKYYWSEVFDEEFPE